MMNMKRIFRLFLALALLGCVCLVPALAAEAASDPDSEVPIDYDALEGETAVYTYLTQEMGLSTAAACGVLANIQYESGFDPTVWGDGGTSHGLCQWHNGRCAALERFCQEHGYDTESVYGQMEYLRYELETSYPGVLSCLQSVADTAEGAYASAWCWCYDFEVPANRSYQADQRGWLAMGVYYPAYAQDAA